MQNVCVFSQDRVYRYALEHRFSDAPGVVNFVMLNPSTADEQQLDPTLRRCKGFAQAWGYGAFVVTNLFAFRATEPTDMKRAADPVGPDNNKIIVQQAQQATEIILGWGAHGSYKHRDKYVLDLLADTVWWKKQGRINYLSKTLAGQPKHPLYLAANLERKPWWSVGQ